MVDPTWQLVIAAFFFGCFIASLFAEWQVRMANKHADEAERIAFEALEMVND